LQEELDCLEMYAKIQRTRYGDRFAMQIDVDRDALGCRMLKLTLQPLIENAIFHGIAPSGQSGFIVIRGRIQSGQLRISIRDNGVGIDQEQCATLLTEHRE